MILLYKKLLIVLFFLLASAGVLWWLQRKKQKLGGGKISRWIDIVGQQYLSPKKRIAVIKVGKQYFLIGISELGIQMLSEVKDPEAKGGEEALADDLFDSVLDRETKEPEFPLGNFKAPTVGVRDLIRKRLQVPRSYR